MNNIPEAAVEAAARALLDMDLGGGGAKLWRKWPKGGAFKTAYRSLARAALEAAAPHMTITHDDTQGMA